MKKTTTKRVIVAFVILLLFVAGFTFVYLKQTESKLLCFKPKACPTTPRGVCMPGGVCFN